ncbi:MAG TPA: hypothetical protein PLZ45_10105 [Ferruginibacter sp.]|nr:hypothetical protein [Chitinophagaceae bacterium]HRI25022.1 hypothetical protein [Ferruginibacter sp.]
MKYLGLAAALLLCTATIAQSKKFNFKLGSEYELPRKSDDLSFFGNDRDGIINLSLKKDELNIVRFDPKSLTQTSEKRIELPEATKNFNSETVTEFNNKDYYWIHSDWDKESKVEALYFDKLDIVAGKLTSTNNKMFETSRLTGDYVSSGFYQVKVENKYKFNYDADHKKLLVSYRLWPEEKNDKKNYDRIGLQVFDDNMKKLWGGEFTMPYTEAIMDNSDFSIDGNGNAYMLAKVYDSEKRREKDKETGRPGYHFEVLKFVKGSNKIITAVVNLDDYFIHETSLIENFNHEMIIACTYSKKSTGTGTDGIFLAALDQNNKVIKYKNGYYEFPLADLQKFESARTRRKMEKKDDYEAPNLVVRNIIVESDGAVLMVMEEYYKVVYRTYDRNTTTTNTTFYYEDIIAGRVSASGQFEWLRKIPKKQKGSTTSYSSQINYNLPGTMGFKLISDASGYYFLYLDNKKNIDIQEDEVPKYHVDGAGGQVVVSKLDRAGVITNKEILFDTREEDVMVFPAKFTQINGNQFIGRAKVKRNRFQPLLITVN